MDIYNSKIAAMVGWLNKAPHGYAVTISKSTTLYSVPIDVVSDSWRAHEDCHKQQISNEGWLLFMCKYLFWNITKGYQNNPYEIAARAKGANT